MVTTTTITPTEARVQIVIPGHQVDLPIDTSMKVSDVLSELIPYLIDTLAAQGKETKWLEDVDAHWSLRQPLRSEPLDEEKTLSEEMIFDGDRLKLVAKDPGEKYPPLIDDVPESLTYWLKQHFPSWENTNLSRHISLITLTALTAIVCGSTLYWASKVLPSATTRFGISAAMAVTAVLAAAIGVVVIRTGKSNYTEVTVPLLTITYLLTGTAGLLVTPRPLGIHQLIVSGCSLFTLAVCLSMLTRINARLHYGVATAALAVTIVCMINMAYESRTEVIGAQLITICFFIMLIASRVALALARISLPRVPATGESYITDSERAGDLDAGSVSNKPSSRAIDSIFNQEQQSLTAYDAMIGILSGALTVLTISAWFIGSHLTSHHWTLFAFVLAITLALIYRGKSFDDARKQAVHLIAAAITPAAFAVGLLVSPPYADNALRAGLTLAILVFGTLIATIYAIQQRQIVSPIVTKLFEIIERLLYASPLVFLVFIMELREKAQGAFL